MKKIQKMLAQDEVERCQRAVVRAERRIIAEVMDMAEHPYWKVLADKLREARLALRRAKRKAAKA